MPFQGLDFYKVDDLFSQEERIVRDAVRRFVDERVVPIIEDCFNKHRFPKELIPELAELGCLGP
ncbi:MAG TPA: acyl-CoA dehydrogenase, partial [Proteobacteria bacterium]|nr:acyl-CoA dehydrogenase [Pseudomonadota bacterium]